MVKFWLQEETLISKRNGGHTYMEKMITIQVAFPAVVFTTAN